MHPIFVPKNGLMHFLPEFSNSIWTILFCVFGLMVIVQLLYTIVIYGRLAFFKNKNEAANDFPPVTIIIAARNEADNIYENLPHILTQDYPQYEVLVVNHQSIDESKHILQAYQQQYPHLRYTEIERSKHLRPGKKLPVTLGIKSAKYEHLLLTDADCKPSSKNWLKEMAGSFTTEKEIVLGFGPYTKEKGFLNRIIRFDTIWIAINYFSFALANLPYMGVGRNLGYTKSAFENANGFKSHYSLSSGDDDLFIQEAAKKKNYAINVSSDAYMFSEPEKTWESWIRQKSRHYTTAPKYQFIKKALLGIYPLTLLAMYILFVILLTDTNFRWITLASFGFIILLKWLVIGRCFIKLNEKSFVPYLPFSELAYAILMPVMYYTVERKTNNRW